MRKFIFGFLFIFIANQTLWAQWKISIVTEMQLKKVQFKQISTGKIVGSKFYDDILLPKGVDTIFNDSMRSNLFIRMKKKNLWGAMNGNLEVIVNPSFHSIDILYERNLLQPSNQNSIIALLAKKDLSWFVFDFQGNKLHKKELTSIQSIGCGLSQPRMMSELDEQLIFKDIADLSTLHLFDHPYLVISNGGVAKTKSFRYKKLVEYGLFDSIAVDVIIERKIIDTLENYQVVSNAKWNLLDLKLKQLKLDQWADSFGFTMIHGKLNVPQNDEKIKLDSFIPESNMNLSFYETSTNSNYQYNFLNYRLNSSFSQFYFHPLIAAFYNSGVQMFDGNPTLNLPRITFKIQKIIGVLIQQNRIFWKCYEGQKISIIDVLKLVENPRLFDWIDGREELTIENDSLKFRGLKCRLGGQFGFYSLIDNQFYPVRKLQNMQLYDGVYVNPSEYFNQTKHIFYIAQSNGKWGVSTMCLLNSKDSVLVPFQYDTIIPEEHYGLKMLKAKMNDQWIYIDYLNNVIDVPPQTDQFLYSKRFFDAGHGQLSTYFLLLNPTGKKVKNAFMLTDQMFVEGISEARFLNLYNGDVILGGKFMVYNEMLRKLVDESLYDSIWLITSNSVHFQSLVGDVNVDYYNFFNPSNKEQVSEMIGSGEFQSIPYFLIFKNGQKAIVSDQNKFIVPFTAEDIEISRKRYYANLNITLNENEEEENQYEFVSKLIFKSKSSQIEVNYNDSN